MKNKPELSETRKLYIPGEGKFFLVLVFSFIIGMLILFFSQK